MRNGYLQVRRISLVLLLMAAVPAWGQGTTDATRYIEDRSSTVLAIFNNNALSQDQRQDRLRDIVAKSFDVPTIAKFVLGRHWADATPADRSEFSRTFEHYMVHIYASRFAQYPDAKVKIRGERQETNDRVVVNSEIKWRGSDQPAKVGWLVKKSQSGYRILDVNIEGISQLVALRDEFSAVIQQHDGKVAGLIEHLKEKTGD